LETIDCHKQCIIAALSNLSNKLKSLFEQQARTAELETKMKEMDEKLMLVGELHSVLSMYLRRLKSDMHRHTKDRDGCEDTGTVLTDANGGVATSGFRKVIKPSVISSASFLSTLGLSQTSKPPPPVGPPPVDPPKRQHDIDHPHGYEYSMSNNGGQTGSSSDLTSSAASNGPLPGTVANYHADNVHIPDMGRPEVSDPTRITGAVSKFLLPDISLKGTADVATCEDTEAAVEPELLVIGSQSTTDIETTTGKTTPNALQEVATGRAVGEVGNVDTEVEEHGDVVGGGEESDVVLSATASFSMVFGTEEVAGVEVLAAKTDGTEIGVGREILGINACSFETAHNLVSAAAGITQVDYHASVGSNQDDDLRSRSDENVDAGHEITDVYGYEENNTAHNHDYDDEDENDRAYKEYTFDNVFDYGDLVAAPMSPEQEVRSLVRTNSKADGHRGDGEYGSSQLDVQYSHNYTNDNRYGTDGLPVGNWTSESNLTPSPTAVFIHNEDNNGSNANNSNIHDDNDDTIGWHIHQLTSPIDVLEQSVDTFAKYVTDSDARILASNANAAKSNRKFSSIGNGNTVSISRNSNASNTDDTIMAFLSQEKDMEQETDVADGVRSVNKFSFDSYEMESSNNHHYDTVAITTGSSSSKSNRDFFDSLSSLLKHTEQLQQNIDSKLQPSRQPSQQQFGSSREDTAALPPKPTSRPTRRAPPRPITSSDRPNLDSNYTLSSSSSTRQNANTVTSRTTAALTSATSANASADDWDARFHAINSSIAQIRGSPPRSQLTTATIAVPVTSVVSNDYNPYHLQVSRSRSASWASASSTASNSDGTFDKSTVFLSQHTDRAFNPRYSSQEAAENSQVNIPAVSAHSDLMVVTSDSRINYDEHTYTASSQFYVDGANYSGRDHTRQSHTTGNDYSTLSSVSQWRDSSRDIVCRDSSPVIAAASAVSAVSQPNFSPGRPSYRTYDDNNYNAPSADIASNYYVARSNSNSYSPRAEENKYYSTDSPKFRVDHTGISYTTAHYDSPTNAATRAPLDTFTVSVKSFDMPFEIKEFELPDIEHIDYFYKPSHSSAGTTEGHTSFGNNASYYY
jgi:hypothetical protein